jgi:hypothetical protein
MPKHLGPNKIKTKRGDIHVRTRDDMTVILWQDRRDVYLLTNIHGVPEDGNFCDSDGKAIKPEIVTDYSRHVLCGQGR